MAIQIADQFTYSGSKPLDARLQFSSVANMKAAAETALYNGCFAYVTATKKYYSYDSSNSIDPTTGRWREYSSGGGEDSNAYHTDDVTETSVANDDYFPFYDTSASTKKKSTWSNLKSLLKTYFDTLYNKYSLPTATSSVLGGVKIGENMLIEDGVINPSYLVVANKFNKSDIYSTTEKVVGCWTDGRPIYQKTFIGTLLKTTAIGTEVVTTITIGASVREFIDFQGTYSNSVYGATSHMINNSRWVEGKLEVVRAALDDNATSGNTNVIRLLNSWYTTDSIYTVTIRYTKTTDAANSFNYADENDYSTSEKIVGTWIDGKPIYQKTFTATMPTCSTEGTDVSNTIVWSTIGISAPSKIISIEGFIDNEAGTYRPLNSVNSTTRRTSAIGISTGISFTNSVTGMSGKNAYVTIQYTKKT